MGSLYLPYKLCFNTSAHWSTRCAVDKHDHSTQKHFLTPDQSIQFYSRNAKCQIVTWSQFCALGPCQGSNQRLSSLRADRRQIIRPPRRLWIHVDIISQMQIWPPYNYINREQCNCYVWPWFFGFKWWRTKSFFYPFWFLNLIINT